MLRISKEHKIGVMDRGNPPVAACDSGDTVIFETLDCADGAVSRTGERDYSGQYVRNPATGPLYVRGARPGERKPLCRFGCKLRREERIDDHARGDDIKQQVVGGPGRFLRKNAELIRGETDRNDDIEDNDLFRGDQAVT